MSHRASPSAATPRWRVAQPWRLLIGGQLVDGAAASGEPAGAPGERLPRAGQGDALDAWGAAVQALAGWAAVDAAERGELLYRAAAALEERRGDERLLTALGAAAEQEHAAAVDASVSFAGWTDKAPLLLAGAAPRGVGSCVVPSLAPLGVVLVVTPARPGLLGVVTASLPALLSGNTLVVVAPELEPRPALCWAQCVVEAGLPAGAVNVLCGDQGVLVRGLLERRDVRGLSWWTSDGALDAELGRWARGSGRRGWRASAGEGSLAPGCPLSGIEAFVEHRTLWQPALT